MGRRLLCFLVPVSALLLSGWATGAQRERDTGTAGNEPAAIRNRVIYNGDWWLKIGAQPYGDLLQSGFLDGIADYFLSHGVRWMANSSSVQNPLIAEFYKRDHRNLTVLVPDAWKRVLTESPPTPPLPGGEKWDGPHGYYNGYWYREGAYEERIGYLQAYMWRLRTYGKQSNAVYPRTLDYYDEKLWNYIQMKNGADYEPVAEILARFRSAVP